MRKITYLLPVCLMCNFADADVLDLTTALQATYRTCVGIDDDLYDMKKLAGINTAVTGVGTGLGVGAVATGLSKAKTDRQVADLERLLDKLKEMTTDPDGGNTTVTKEAKDAFYTQFEQSYDIALQNKPKTQNQLDELNKKSKKLGNWRTGLLAANTATNIAGVLIANKNKVSDDLQSKIDRCVTNVKGLKNSISAAKAAGEDTAEAEQIYDACRDYEFVDLSPINKRAKGAMISSAVGIVTGGAGTATSAMANSNKVRQGDEQKEKNLNTAANALAVGSTVASASATVFNAAQIAAIKKVANVSVKCSEVLK